MAVVSVFRGFYLLLSASYDVLFPKGWFGACNIFTFVLYELSFFATLVFGP